MKKVLVLVIICGCLTGIAQGNLIDGLYAYWSFDEGSGDTAHDLANGYDGTVDGALWTSGVVGGALWLDGIDDYVALPDNEPIWLPENDFTLSLWVFFEREVGTQELLLDLNFADSSSPGNELGYTLIRKDDGTIFFEITTLTEPDDKLYSDTVLLPNTWYHIVAVRNGTYQAVYLNGSLDGSRTCSSSPIDFTGGYDDDKANIGRYTRQNQDPRFHLHGTIDEVMIYERGLSEDEIKKLYLMGIGLKELEIVGPNELAEQSQAQYQAIAVYNDNSTKDVTGLADWAVYPDMFAQITEDGLLETSLLNMPTEQVTVYTEYAEGNDVVTAEKDVEIYAVCPEGSALDFDGQDDYVDCGYHFAEITSSPNKTIMAWAKPDTNDFSGQEAQEGRLLTLYRDLGYSGFIIMAKGNPTTWQGLYATAGNWYDYVDSGILLESDQWVHVALVQDGAHVSLYINGELVKEADDATIPVMNRRANATVGCFYSGSSRYSFFDGVIDEPAIFNRALTQQEISKIVGYGPGSGVPNLSAYWSFDEGSGQVANDDSGNGNNGILGGSLAPNDSDPCWVEPGAPYRCTREQMIERNLYGALEHKDRAAEEIQAALCQERATKCMLWQMFLEREYELWKPRQIWRAVTYIMQSMIKEEHCKKDLVKSERDLERAVQTLELDK